MVKQRPVSVDFSKHSEKEEVEKKKGKGEESNIEKNRAIGVQKSLTQHGKLLRSTTKREDQGHREQ